MSDDDLDPWASRPTYVPLPPLPVAVAADSEETSDAEVGTRRPRRWLFATVAVLLVAGGAGAATLLSADDGPSHPEAWDPRVQELVDFVEAERDLTFEHPVTIEFMTEAEWSAQAKEGIDDLTDEDRLLLEQGEGMFRAVGLAEGDLDLLASIESITSGGTVGRYTFDDERITVRGESIDIKSSGTIVHELTHALQDQLFDIDELMESAEDSEEPSSLRMLVEGDAERIEDAWRDGLSADARAEYDAAAAKESEEGLAALQAVPDSIVTFFASDYILGPLFIKVLLADGGNGAINRAFGDPPGPEEHALNPLSYLAGDLARPVEVPALADGETALEGFEGEFGATAWFLMLAERIDPIAALQAIDGWGGDAYVVFDRAGTTCVRARFLDENDPGAAAMTAALQQWAQRMPPAAGVSVVQDGDLVDLETCDAGADADLLEGEGRSSKAIAVPAVRAEFALSVLEGGGTAEQARCFAQGVLPRVSFEQLLVDELSPEDRAALQTAAAEVAVACRGAG